MSYRLVVSDLDGTLRAEGRPVSLRVRQAIERAQAAGVRVAIATGRMHLTVEPFARDLGLTEAVICEHGASIYDMRSNTLLYSRTMPLDLTRQVLAQAGPSGATLLCIDGCFYAEALTPDAVRFIGQYLDQEHVRVIPHLAESLSEGPAKLIFINEPEVASRLFAELSAQWGDRLQVVQSFPRYVELTHREVSKANAAAWLAERWGIARQEVIAIGDWDNDRSMIEWAGLGVAMGNAIDSVKAVAAHIAPPVDQDGVADVIERFVLKSGTRSDER